MKFGKYKGTHDGYLKEYGILHQRNIKFFPKEFKYVGEDIIISKKNFQKVGFDIRFHLLPSTNAIKTQDKQSILLQLKNLDGDSLVIITILALRQDYILAKKTLTLKIKIFM